jgi:hypothetical protein
LSFRDGSNTRSTWRFNARITPIRANIGGPLCSATGNSACHRGLPFFGIAFCLGQCGDVLRRVAERDQWFPALQNDRIENR